MAVFFTSDTHFGHGGALGLFRRPFASVAEMDEAMVRRWNETVCAGDEVWHLGDLAVGRKPDRIHELLAGLNGTKHLIAGNNDGPAAVEAPHWASVQHYAELEIGDRLLVLCHYPFRSWNRMARGAINLHGHSHGRLDPLPRQLDVGVDVHDFRPIPFEAIVARFRRRRARG